MLALAGMIGADARVPSMVLQRAPLGRRGSYLATGLNVLQCLGWAIFELIVIATAAAALSERRVRLRGDAGRGSSSSACSRPCSRCSGRSASCAGSCASSRSGSVLASIVYLAWWILDHGDVATLWVEPGHGGSFWLAVDLVIALCVSWIPLAADYTRFSHDRRGAFWGVGLGYLLPTLFQFGFGAILVLCASSTRRPDGGADAVAAGGVGGFLALLALTVDETDEAFANVYSAAVSSRTCSPRSRSGADRRRGRGRDRRRARARPHRTSSSSCCSGPFGWSHW